MSDASLLLFYYFGSLGLVLLFACLVRILLIRRRYKETEQMIQQGKWNTFILIKFLIFLRVFLGFSFHTINMGNSTAILVQPPATRQNLPQLFTQPPPYSTVVSVLQTPPPSYHTAQIMQQQQSQHQNASENVRNEPERFWWIELLRVVFLF